MSWIAWVSIGVYVAGAVALWLYLVGHRLPGCAVPALVFILPVLLWPVVLVVGIVGLLLEGLADIVNGAAETVRKWAYKE